MSCFSSQMYFDVQIIIEKYFRCTTNKMKIRGNLANFLLLSFYLSLFISQICSYIFFYLSLYLFLILSFYLILSPNIYFSQCLNYLSIYLAKYLILFLLLLLKYIFLAQSLSNLCELQFWVQFLFWSFVTPPPIPLLYKGSVQTIDVHFNYLQILF